MKKSQINLGESLKNIVFISLIVLMVMGAFSTIGCEQSSGGGSSSVPGGDLPGDTGNGDVVVDPIFAPLEMWSTPQLEKIGFTDGSSNWEGRSNPDSTDGVSKATVVSRLEDRDGWTVDGTVVNSRTTKSMTGQSLLPSIDIYRTGNTITVSAARASNGNVNVTFRLILVNSDSNSDLLGKGFVTEPMEFTGTVTSPFTKIYTRDIVIGDITSVAGKKLEETLTALGTYKVFAMEEGLNDSFWMPDLKYCDTNIYPVLEVNL